MNTRQFFTRLVLFLFIAPVALAQVQISIITRSPMPPQLSAWERDRSLVQVAIVNPAGSPGHNGARFCFTVRNTETGEVVVRTIDNDPDIPRISIPPGPATMMRYGPDLIVPRAITVDPRYRDVARATNSLPEGRYEFCVRLLDAAGGEIATTGNTCGRFTVMLPDPPQLLEPADGAAIERTSLPRFTWTPSIPTGIQPQYRLRIVPVYGHQNREVAVERNPPAADRILSGTIYQYSPADPSLAMFPAADSFAWQVTLQEPTGMALAHSEIFTFSINGSNMLGLTPRTDGENPPVAGDDNSTGKTDGSNAGGNNGGDALRGANGDDEVKENDCKKKLAELATAIAEAEQKARDAAARADAARVKAEGIDCEKKIADLEKQAADLEKEIKDLKAKQNKILEEMRKIHQKEGLNFGWAFGSDGSVRYSAISRNGKWLDGVSAGAVKLSRELDKLNKEYKEKLAKLKKLREEIKRLKKDCPKQKKAAEEEAARKAEEAKKAQDEVNRLREEYERLKKDCPDDEQGGSDDGSGSSDKPDGSGTGHGSGTGGTDNGGGSNDGAGKDAPCKKKLEELRQALTEAEQKAGAAEDAADDAEAAAANPPCQKQIADMEKEIATLEAEVKDLKAQQDKILKEMRDIHGKEGFSFGWAFKSDGTLRYSAISPDAKWLDGAVTAGAVKLARELDKLNKEYKEKLAKLKKLREDLAKLKKECEKEKGALKAEAAKKRAEAKKARAEADRLRKEYEQAKKDCPEDGKGAGDNGGSGSGSGSDKGTDSDSGNGSGNDSGNGSGNGSGSNSGNPLDRDLQGEVPIEMIQLQLRSTRPLQMDADGAKNRAVDCSRIRASRGTAATGGMLIHGRAGSADAGATITITDQNGLSVTVKAGKDGSFTVRESDLPDGFDHTPGHVLRVSDGKSICTVIIDK